VARQNFSHGGRNFSSDQNFSHPGRWVWLIDRVLADDDRTYRATILIAHLTILLLIAATVVVTAVAVLARGHWWIPLASGSGLTGVALVSAWLRRRRLPSTTGCSAIVARGRGSGEPVLCQ
jgi:membrane protein implicated in regulation of membrane protease activity